MPAMQDYVIELREVIARATPQLLALADEVNSEPVNPGKWSRREIIGHLIDSAANNHRRFVLGQLEDNLDFPGYQQERLGESAAICGSSVGGVGCALAKLQSASCASHGGVKRRVAREGAQDSQFQ